MKLLASLAARIAAAIQDGPAAIRLLRATLTAEAEQPGTSALKRKMLRAADEQLRAADPGEGEGTDQERLERAFDALGERGIVALTDAGYTLSDGWEEVAAARGERDRGAVFYHRQDAERAAEGGGLSLAFGAFAGDEAATRAIGEEVAATLRAHGLAVTWNGQADTRLLLEGFVWEEAGGRERGRSLAIMACSFEHRIAVMKACRALLGMDLATARAGLDGLKPLAWRWDTSPPWVVARGLGRGEAERIAAGLRAAGAEVEVC